MVAVAAYLLGSIPFGFIVAKAKGIDIRAVGSGNIGATNAMRVLGKPAGIFVLLLDAAKGYAAVFVLPLVAVNLLGATHTSDDELYRSCVIAGIFAVLGHNYTCWLKFKGGKGIATTAGVYLSLAPWALLVALGVFILALLLTRYVSVASMSGAVALPVTVSPMATAHWMGAAPRYRGSSEACRLMQPSRGSASIQGGMMRP